MDAASILARTPPVHLQADMRRRVYLRVNDLKISGQTSDKRVRDIREEERLLMVRQWAIYLQRSGISGVRVRDAILPCLSEWLERSHGSMEFHLTQIFNGYGCFASYVYRIQKIESDTCEHCEAGVADTADHTLRECSAWTGEREVLRKNVGDDLSLGKITREILNSRDSWDAMVNFARAVMLSKERAEREREKQRSPPDRSSRDSSSSDADVP